MMVYIVMIIMGWFMWVKEYRQQDSESLSLSAA
jgi:hypothetical protein